MKRTLCFFACLLFAACSYAMNQKDDASALHKAVTDFAVGGAMGMAGTTAYQPFLRVKNYLQLKHVAKEGASHLKDCAKVQTSGQQMPRKFLSRAMFSWLFQGYGVNCAGAVPTYAATLASNAGFRKLAAHVSGQEEPSFAAELAAAGASGAVGGAFGLSFDYYALVKQDSANAQKSWNEIRKQFPLRQAMMRGLGAMCAREATFGSFLLAVYPWLKKQCENRNVPAAALVSGACAGLAGAATTQALDTIKTLQQKQGAKFVPTVAGVLNEGGFKVLHAGFAPRAACYVLALTAMSSAHQWLKRMVD